ncbi:hypothetical protein [Bradyrhizobium iriomotense]|uniref:hypothetical protein n=1 Tax=Bradyrhizobium iriomotense TaxID=441950 RepID=UPI001B8A7BB0|nr:hypothetical protein [Bradyrhizobium iriomotense]MBR0781653.1 hypothetical protein [Bradyrhizobium iriomotense]
MKVLVLVVSLAAAAIAPANADDRRTSRTGPAESPTTGLGCTVGVWPAFAACKNVYNYKTYGDCHTDAIKMGWRGNDIWWYCSSIGLKN